MAYDYDKLYGETRDALGPPNAVFAAFFDEIGKRQISVLDLGCGQGRDALPIARRGNRVIGIDLSPNGIHDLMAAARQEKLDAKGLIADISEYQPDGQFDVILIDRTLHMLTRATRLVVLERMLDHVVEGGWLLIADEPSNLEDFCATISGHEADWTIDQRQRGHLLAQRA